MDDVDVHDCTGILFMIDGVRDRNQNLVYGTDRNFNDALINETLRDLQVVKITGLQMESSRDATILTTITW